MFTILWCRRVRFALTAAVTVATSSYTTSSAAVPLSVTPHNIPSTFTTSSLFRLTASAHCLTTTHSQLLTIPRLCITPTTRQSKPSRLRRKRHNHPPPVIADNTETGEDTHADASLESFDDELDAIDKMFTCATNSVDTIDASPSDPGALPSDTAQLDAIVSRDNPQLHHCTVLRWTGPHCTCCGELALQKNMQQAKGFVYFENSDNRPVQNSHHAILGAHSRHNTGFCGTIY